MPPELAGARTLFCGFHHFRPELARAILADAAGQRCPIGVFEATARTPLCLLLVLGTPLLVWLITPLARPFRPGRLLWTYLVPLVPFLVLWDGLVSCLRTYTVEELRTMVGELEAPGYRWEVGRARLGLVSSPYLMGYPADPAAA